MKNILIIGGDSYIGSKFILRYHNTFNFRIVSRHSTKTRERKSIFNEIVIKNFFELKNNVFKDIDTIINFAAIVHKSDNVSKDLYKKINYDLPIFLYQKALNNNIKHFIQMSTIAVYERSTIINVNSKTHPKTKYAFYKLKTDNHLLKSKSKKTFVTCIRPPMVYGVDAPGNMIKLIKLAMSPFPLPFKNIEAKVSFISVNNLMVFLNSVVKNELFGIFLPTDKKETSTQEIVKLVRKVLNRNSNIFSMPDFVDKIIKFLVPNIHTKLFNELVVECNVPKKFYEPENQIKDVIKKIIMKI